MPVADLPVFKASGRPGGTDLFGLRTGLGIHRLAAGFGEVEDFSQERLRAAECQRRVPDGQPGENGVVVRVLVERGLRGGRSAVFGAVYGRFEQGNVVGDKIPVSDVNRSYEVALVGGDRLDRMALVVDEVSLRRRMGSAELVLGFGEERVHVRAAALELEARDGARFVRRLVERGEGDEEIRQFQLVGAR